MSLKKNMNHIKLAILEAKKSTMTSHHGCVAVYNNRVIASSYNYYNRLLQGYIEKR